MVDMRLSVRATGTGFRLRLQYATDRYSAAMADGILHSTVKATTSESERAFRRTLPPGVSERSGWRGSFACDYASRRCVLTVS